jgi:hypothetical protein
MSKITPLSAALLLVASGNLMANEHVAEIEQIGTGNIAEQIQSGTLQRSFVLQNGNDNSALTDQSGTSGEGSQASIEQIGTLNSAEVYQVHSSQPGLASAAIYQTGSSNSAHVEQQESLGELSATATVRQEGSGNQLDARQIWVGNELNVVSVGQDNTVMIDQSGFSTASVQQSGIANRAQLEQLSFGIGGGFAVVEQEGTANQADIYQTSGRYPAGDVFLQQVGTDNIAQIRASDGYSTLDYAQRGTGNELYASFGGQGSSISGYSEGSYNLVEIAQVGDGNSLDIAQVGSYNQIDAYQGFHAHEALISQTGDSNQAFLRQETLSVGGHSASIVQNGSANIANVVQQ